MHNTSLLLLLLIGLLLAACGGGTTAGAAGRPQIVLEATALELGDLSNGVVAERDVTVTNAGDAPLVVESVMTTCGCTNAALEPMTLAPGQSGTLHIAFDSGAHGPDLRGDVMRRVMLASNDPAQPEVVVELTANITDPVAP